MLYAALGILLLDIVQGFDGTEQLTSVKSAQGMLRWSVPIMLAGLGGLFSERAGIVNIGLEGMMILGTWFGAWGAIEFGAYGGLIVGALGGAIGGLIHGVATIRFNVDHIISGVAINFAAPGVARYLSSEIFTGMQGGGITQSPSVPGVGRFTMPLLAGGWGSPDWLGDLDQADIPFVSDVAGLSKGMMTDLSIATIIAFLIVPLSAWLLWKTRFGLRVRISGENPHAAESQGIDVSRYRYIAVAISGALAGLGGAFIVSPELSGIYLEGQTNERGFIGLAALIFGNWRPGGVMSGALLFGFIFGNGLIDFDGNASHALLLAMTILLLVVAFNAWRHDRRSDAIGASTLAVLLGGWYLFSDTVPDWWTDILPFIIVLLVLVFLAQRLRMPRALGQPYRAGDS
ncbi:MAG: ABC-type uncharacterized transport system permease subunit [Verrucomicrobiales bacterium]|jgi:ABC-type uncharacterized transport system permease subunit